MNNHNDQAHNENWRTQNYMENSRNHGMTRPDGYYNPYQAPQFVSDYMQQDYMYPNMVPSYRPSEYPTPPTNPQSYNSFGMMTPEAYKKYYHKVQAYLMQNTNFVMKEYDSQNNDMMQAQNVRNFNSMGYNMNSALDHQQMIQQSPFSPQPQMLKQKMRGQKQVIVIQSDEQKLEQLQQLRQQKKQSKSQILQISSRTQQKHPPKVLMEEPQLQNQKNQPQLIQKKQLQQSVQKQNKLYVDEIEKQSNNLHNKALRNQFLSQEQLLIQLKPQHNDIHTLSNNLNKNNNNVVPLSVIDEFCQKIFHQLETSDLPDTMTKLFLKYKTVQTRAKYEQNQEISHKILQLFKIYRAIIWFEKQRKIWMENQLSQVVFNDLFKKIPKSKVSQLQGINLNEIQKKKEKFFRQFQDNFAESKNFIDQENQLNEEQIRQIREQLNEFRRSQYPFGSSSYPSKTKKIGKQRMSKKQRQNLTKKQSQQFNFSQDGQLNMKYGKYLQLPQWVSQRKLRQRKKKKNKKQRNLQQKLLKQKQGIQKSRSQRQRDAKQKSQGNQSKQLSIQLSKQDQAAIQKISRWAQKTLAGTIQQKQKQKNKKLTGDKDKQKSKDNSGSMSNHIQNSNGRNGRNDPFKVIKQHSNSNNNQSNKDSSNNNNNTSISSNKKLKQRSTKASQNLFRQQLLQKIASSKQSKQATLLPNLITFSFSNNLSQSEKQQYQKELAHLAKELRNNESHGKIRIGKEYYQAKMPSYIKSQKGTVLSQFVELQQLIKEKKEKLMERKMSVLTF